MADTAAADVCSFGAQVNSRIHRTLSSIISTTYNKHIVDNNGVPRLLELGISGDMESKLEAVASLANLLMSNGNKKSIFCDGGRWANFIRKKTRVAFFSGGYISHSLLASHSPFCSDQLIDNFHII